MDDCVVGDRTVIALTGDDAEHFLHNLITTNVETLEDGELRAGALLTPQGKVMFDFLISRMDGGYRLDIASDNADAFLRRLTLYKLRAKVEIETQQQSVSAILGQCDSATSHDDSTLVADRRFPYGVMTRRYGGAPATGNMVAYESARVAHGVVESGLDYALGDAFAHDVSLDQNGGVDFRKGCYVGQEVVSRMHHRKTARRRVVIVEGDGLTQGSSLTADGKPAGSVGTVSGSRALSIARLDRLQDAMDSGAPITVDETPVTVTLPPNVSYDWPKPDVESSDA